MRRIAGAANSTTGIIISQAIAHAPSQCGRNVPSFEERATCAIPARDGAWSAGLNHLPKTKWL